MLVWIFIVRVSAPVSKKVKWDRTKIWKQWLFEAVNTKNEQRLLSDTSRAKLTASTNVASGAVENSLVVVLPAKTNINVCGCLGWDSVAYFLIYFLWWDTWCFSSNQLIIKNGCARKTERRGIINKHIYIHCQKVISMYFSLTLNFMLLNCVLPHIFFNIYISVDMCDAARSCQFQEVRTVYLLDCLSEVGSVETLQRLMGFNEPCCNLSTNYMMYVSWSWNLHCSLILNRLWHSGESVNNMFRSYFTLKWKENMKVIFCIKKEYY